jgi:protocatechuate 3,4-dioxygenase beta subunit
MKRLTSVFQLLLLTLIICSAAAVYNSTAEAHSSAAVLNRIEGIVWDPYRRPVRDLYVELQNENYFALARVRTDSTGRFSFIGV